MSRKWTVSKLLCESQGLPCHTPHVLMQVSPSVLFDVIAVVTGRVYSVLLSVSPFAATSSSHSPPAITSSSVIKLTMQF